MSGQWGKNTRGTCSKCGKPSASYKPVIVCQDCRRLARTRVCALGSCGAQFVVEHNEKTNRYCSPQCWYIAARVTYRKICAWCGRGFEVGSQHQRQESCGRHECIHGLRLERRGFDVAGRKQRDAEVWRQERQRAEDRAAMDAYLREQENYAAELAAKIAERRAEWEAERIERGGRRPMITSENRLNRQREKHAAEIAELDRQAE